MTKKSDTQTAETKAKSTKPSIVIPNTVLKLTLTWKEVEPQFHKTLNKLSASLKMPGFRLGKVPAQIAYEQIGEDKLIEKTLEEILPEAYQKLLLKEKKTPLTLPMIKLLSAKPKEDWVVEIQIAQEPELDLSSYQKIIAKAQAEFTKNLKTQKPDPKKPELSAEQTRDQMLAFVLSSLVKELSPKVPELVLRQEVEHELHHLAQTLAKLKMSFSDYLAKRQIKDQDLTQELASIALGRLQTQFLLKAIAQDQKLKTTEEVLNFLAPKV